MFAAIASGREDRVHSAIQQWRTRDLAGTCDQSFRSFGCFVATGGAHGVSRVAEGIGLGRARLEMPRAQTAPAITDGDGHDVRTVVNALALPGNAALSAIKGQFAVVFWNDERQELVAARDAIGVAPLYYRVSDGTLTLSDNLDLCAGECAFDQDYIAEFIANCGNPHTTRTIRQGALALGPGGWLRWRDGRLTVGRFWSPLDVPQQAITLKEAASEFRELVRRSVRSQLEPGALTWAHLSGGLDSSSVVSLAAQDEEMCGRIGGTLTFQDSLANGDDTALVNAVLERYPSRNVTISDWWPWRSDAIGPPVTDRPSRDYPFFGRDRHAASLVTGHGGRAMLSGIGPDLYLPQTAAHCPDLVWTGQFSRALRELHSWSVLTRGSLWRVGVTEGLLPLVSRTASARLKQSLSRVPNWFTRGFLARHPVRQLIAGTGAPAGPRGHYYAHMVADHLSALASRLSNWLYSPGIEIRHPLLQQSLVEFCLGLPWHLRTDVYWPKPVLRTAMKGVLPESIRNRAGGSLLAPRILWALRHEQQQLNRLLETSVLAEMGCIEPAPVRQALQSLGVFHNREASYLYALLSLETWLSVKSGRWSGVLNTNVNDAV
jgi:asparagine synthase (glutamine-hydrolysing)